jgi:hypothetical protein
MAGQQRQPGGLYVKIGPSCSAMMSSSIVLSWRSAKASWARQSTGDLQGDVSATYACHQTHSRAQAGNTTCH